jgi:UDP:flavonoid glycosyltransferase YjiC (YdhE family)
MRVLFSCIPSEGHFRPVVPLAHALAARGHEVAFAVSADWRPRVEEAGFESFAAGPSVEEAQSTFAAERDEIFRLPREEWRPRLFTGIFAVRHAPAKHPALASVADAFAPDAIVHDSADLAAPLVAAARGLPSVNHSFGALVPLHTLERAHAAVDPLWRAAGLEPAPYAGAFRGLYVDLAPPTFALEEPHEPSIRLRPTAGVRGSAPPWLDELGAPLVYATLGTIWNRREFFADLLAALEGPFAALVTTGRDVDPAALGPVPPNVRVERFVPQADVLDRCDAVVTHGGSGTTLGALAHGLPLVLLPKGADQFDNADRCAAAGAGLVLPPPQATAEAIADALRRVLSEPSFREGARRIQTEIEAMPPVDEVATAVEEHAARG